jgi:hypothetical protein
VALVQSSAKSDKIMGFLNTSHKPLEYKTQASQTQVTSLSA